MHHAYFIVETIQCVKYSRKVQTFLGKIRIFLYLYLDFELFDYYILI